MNVKDKGLEEIREDAYLLEVLSKDESLRNAIIRKEKKVIKETKKELHNQIRDLQKHETKRVIKVRIEERERIFKGLEKYFFPDGNDEDFKEYQRLKKKLKQEKTK